MKNPSAGKRSKTQDALPHDIIIAAATGAGIQVVKEAANAANKAVKRAVAKRKASREKSTIILTDKEDSSDA